MQTDRRSILAGVGSAVAVSLIGRPAWAQDKTPAAPPLSVFAATPYIDQIALSPDGLRIAFITQSGDAKSLGCIDLATKTIKIYPLNATFAIGATKIHALFWADNKRVVLRDSVTASLPQKNEYDQARIIDIETHVVTLLFEGMRPVLPIVYTNLGRIKVKDAYFVTASTWSSDGQPTHTLCSFDPNRRISPRGLGSGREIENWALSPSGMPMGYSQFHDVGKSSSRAWSLYSIVDPTVKAEMDADYKKVFSVQGGEVFPVLLGLGRDGRSLLIAIKGEDGVRHYREIAPDGSVSDPLEAADHFDVMPLFHPVTGALAGFAYNGDTVVYDYFDPVMKALAAAVPKMIGAQYRFTLVDFAEDPRKMIVYGESPTDAGSYFFIDFSTGSGVPISANYPDLPKAWITTKQPIQYKSTDRLDIHGYLTLPPRKPTTALPLIVLPHGGPASRDYGDFDWEAQAFASRGYAVLQPNFRGSSGYGPDFQTAGDGEWGSKMQSDLIDGIQALAAQGTVDPKRVAIFGASYGGYAALAGATLDPAGTYRCAVSVAGVSDIRAMLDYQAVNDDLGAKGLSIQLERHRLGDPAHYDAISPARQAMKAYCPILLMHGTDDTVVPVDQSRRMERALKDAGKAVKFISFEHQTHWEDISSARIAMIEAAMDFVTQYNPA